MRIPEVRDRLRELADELDCFELHILAEELYRRPYERGRVTSRRVTTKTKQEIRRVRRLNPDLSQDEIARAIGVNNGRVSEALKGYRT